MNPPDAVAEPVGGPSGPPFSSSPFHDVFRGLERCLDGGYRALAKVAVGLALGWWLYVPVHELLHALGCVATGGTVTRLEISRVYGGELLARFLPFVHPQSEYAGRLSGFSTGGSDLVYLATDLAPFVLTLFPGWWWLRRAGRRGDATSYGAALPVALAPLLSLPGDAYEIGAIAATRLPPFVAGAALLRGDDLGKKVGELSTAGADARLWGGFATAVSVGAAWALVTVLLAGLVARLFGEGPIPPRPRLNFSGGSRVPL